jgi:hypothetical protein
LVERVIDVDDAVGSSPSPRTDIVLLFRYNNRMNNKRQILNAEDFFLIGSIFCVVILSVIYFFPENNSAGLAHRNSVDTKISQYSDKNITLNAIVTDLQYRKVAFSSPPSENASLFSNQIAAVARAVKSFSISLTNKKGEPKEAGSWVWTPVMTMSPEYMESILADAKTTGINTIYISIDTYLDVFVMPKGEAREKQKEAYLEQLDRFISLANSKGIAVDAEAGWRNWAEDYNVYKAFAIFNFIKTFNATHTNKFRGFQYDVEPYLLDSYDKNKAAVLKNFVKLVDQTEYFLSDSNLRFSVVVPDFYDGKDKVTPKFSYGDKKDYTFGHLLNILDRRADSSIIIMSYRSFASGYDGSIEISKNEMETARDGAYSTKIIIAQETGEVLPPYITFYKTSKNYLFEQIGRINSTFDPNPNFGGIAIHYTNAFLALK